MSKKTLMKVIALAIFISALVLGHYPRVLGDGIIFYFSPTPDPFDDYYWNYVNPPEIYMSLNNNTKYNADYLREGRTIFTSDTITIEVDEGTRSDAYLYLYKISYEASWENKTVWGNRTISYQSSHHPNIASNDYRISDLASFTFNITGIPEGHQTLKVTAEEGGFSVGGGKPENPFSYIISSTVNFNVINPPSLSPSPSPSPSHSPSSSPSATPTRKPTPEPTLTPNPTSNGNEPVDWTPMVLAALVVVAVAAGALAYLWRRKRN